MRRSPSAGCDPSAGQPRYAGTEETGRQPLSLRAFVFLRPCDTMIAIQPFPLSPRPVLPFSADAYFRDFVPSGKSRVKYLNIHPPQRIQIDTISHKQTLSNAKKASFAPLSTNKSTCYWLRTDASVPPYRRVRTVVVVRPYENTHLSPFFSPRTTPISDV